MQMKRKEQKEDIKKYFEAVSKEYDLGKADELIKYVFKQIKRA